MVKRSEGNVTDLETHQRLGRAREFIDHCYDHPLEFYRDKLGLRVDTEKACSFFPTERPYGIEAVFKDNSGNWFSLTQPS